MIFKFLLIYSYLIVNRAECVVISASFPRLNYGTNIGPQYRAPAFKSTGSTKLSQNNFGFIKPGVNKPINSFTGNIAVNAPLKPVTTWPNVNTSPNAPPKPSVWNPVPAPNPVVKNDWPYARQPAYNPHFKVVSPVPLPRPEVQKDRPYVKQQPYNPNFNVPQQLKPAILYPGTTPRPVVQSRWPPYNPHYNTTPKPVVQDDWLYAKQPAYNPHFKVPPTPANRNLAPSQPQAPYNPHFKELSEHTTQNYGPNPRQSLLTKPPSSTNQNHLFNPKQSANNPHFKVPPTPTIANRNLGPNQRQPPYHPHFKELSEHTTQNYGPNPRQPVLTKPPSSTKQNHLFNPKQPAYNSDFVPPISTAIHRNLGPNQSQPPIIPHSKKVSGPTALNQGSMQRQPRQNPLMPETSTIKSHLLNSMSTLYPLMTTAQQSKNDQGKNVAWKFAGVLGALHTFVKKLTKNHRSTNVKQTYENPILLSPEDSEDKFPVMDLLNSYSPKDSNPFSSRESLQKGLISNKLPAVHRHNLETKQIYKGKPYILAAIVVSSVLAMTALTGGIIFFYKKKN